MKKLLLVLVAVMLTTLLFVSCQNEKEDSSDPSNTGKNTDTVTDTDTVTGTDTVTDTDTEESNTTEDFESKALLISVEEIYGKWIMMDTSLRTLEIKEDNTVIMGSCTYALNYSSGGDEGEWQQYYLRPLDSTEASNEYGDDFFAIGELKLSLTSTGAIRLKIHIYDSSESEEYEGYYFREDKVDMITINESNWEQYFEIRMESEPSYDPVSREMSKIVTGWQFGLKKDYMSSIADCSISCESRGGNEAMYLVSYNLETGDYSLKEYSVGEVEAMGYALEKEDKYSSFKVSDGLTTDFKVAATFSYTNGRKPMWLSDDGKIAYQECYLKKDVEIVEISGVLVLIK